MIIGEIYKKEELNILNLDAYVINVAHFSSPSSSYFTIEEAEEIIKESKKPVFLKLMPLYKDEDFLGLRNLLKRMKGIKGLIFQDLGLVSLIEEILPDAELIYDPRTFVTTKEDSLYFKNTNIHTLGLSTTLNLKELDQVLDGSDVSYMGHVFGFEEMFYSERKHFSNYKEEYGFLDLKDKYDVYLKEETRNDFYHALEDERGFYIFRDKKINMFDFLDHFKRCKYLFLERIFISDDEYKDAVNLFNGTITRDEFISIHKEKFDTGFLFREVGLLWGNKDEA